MGIETLCIAAVAKCWPCVLGESVLVVVGTQSAQPAGRGSVRPVPTVKAHGIIKTLHFILVTPGLQGEF